MGYTRTLFHRNTGHTDCDICGHAQNTIQILQDDTTGKYKLTRYSPCFDTFTVEDLDQPELLELIKRSSFLVQTRRARNDLRDFVKELKRGDHDRAKPVEPPQRETVNFDDLLVMDEVIPEPAFAPEDLARVTSPSFWRWVGRNDIYPVPDHSLHDITLPLEEGPF